MWMGASRRTLLLCCVGISDVPPLPQPLMHRLIMADRSEGGPGSQGIGRASLNHDLCK